MRNLLAAFVVLMSAGMGSACAVTPQAYAAMGQGQWVLDVIWAQREFEGGTFKPPEPKGDPIAIKGPPRRNMRLTYLRSEFRFRSQKGGVAKLQSAPVWKDMPRAIKAAGVSLSGCDLAGMTHLHVSKRESKTYAYSFDIIPLTATRAAGVRWIDKTYPNGVETLQREIYVLRRVN